MNLKSSMDGSFASVSSTLVGVHESVSLPSDIFVLYAAPDDRRDFDPLYERTSTGCVAAAAVDVVEEGARGPYVVVKSMRSLLRFDTAPFTGC